MIAKQWHLAHGRNLELGATSRIMGVLNVTPDSFSDGGRFATPDLAIAQAERMIGEGADIIDIGGESTRPGAEAITAIEEQRRILPVIEALAGRDGVALSVDTYRAETAALAVKAGAHIVNDVWGLQRDSGMARVAAETGAGLVVMHTGRGRERLDDPIADQIAFLTASLALAAKAGVPSSSILLDPGFGFAKETPESNLDLILRFRELLALGLPIAVGTSRKRFLGSVTGRSAEERDVVTAASCAILRLEGASVFRVHNVAFSKDALALADAMIAREQALGAAA